MSDHPPVRTFKPRRRSLSPGADPGVRALAPRFTLAEEGPLTRPRRGVRAKGQRGARHRVRYRRLPAHDGRGPADLDVIGVEVHTPGIAGALAGIEEHGLTNVRLVHGDTLQFVSRVPCESLTSIRIFFPDPWPKVRHHHRRLVRDDVVARLSRCCAQRLVPPRHGQRPLRRADANGVRRECRIARGRSRARTSARSPATSRRASRPATRSSISGTTASLER